MQILRIILFILLIIFSGCSNLSERYDIQRRWESIFAVDYLVDDDNKFQLYCGTCFIIRYKENDFLITASHVIPNSKQKKVAFRTSSNKNVMFEFDKVYIISDIDVAAFKIKSCSIKYKPYDYIKSLNFDEVITKGYFRRGQNHNPDYFFSKGKFNYFFNKGERLFTTCRVYKGMSGGPVLYKDKVIGVTTDQVIGGAFHTSIDIVLSTLDNQL